MEEDRTEVIETTPNTQSAREVVTRTSAPRTEVYSRTRPAAEVEHSEVVAYDPFAERRLAAYRLTQLIYWIFGLVEGLITVRLVLKALGANPAAGFAEFIYGITTPLVLPFLGLFSNLQYQGSVLEISSLVAL